MLKYSPVIREGIPQLQKGSKDYFKYWNTQIDRCKNGYKPNGGVHIPGAYYFYLNFSKILARDEATNRKKLQAPWYRDLDHEYYDHVYDCKAKGEGLIVLKARDKGFSYMNANMGLYEWTFFPHNEIGIGAATPSYVSSVRTKIINSWNKLPPELRIKKDLKDNDMMMQSGYRVKEQGTWVEKGLKSIMHFRCMDNPDAFRGERLGMMIFEEAGEMKQLIRAYISSEPCFKDGAVQFGVPIIGGTSNVMNKADDFMKMWYESETYNLRQFFIPASKALYGFFDIKTGKSDELNARQHFEDRRAKLRKGKDKSAYYLHLQEYPLEPEDAFMQSNKSPFDLEKINGQIANILASKSIQGLVQRGRLEWKNRRKFEVEFVLDNDGEVLITDHPRVDVLNLDVGAVDSYYQTEAPSSDSKGCAIIFRRAHGGIDTETNLPIAMYVDRPYTKDIWFENNLKLAAYYGCKLLVEYTDEMFFDWFYKQKATQFLKERPLSADAPWGRVANKYGVHMKSYQKNLLIELIDEYVKQSCEGIYFLDLLKDLADFGIRNTDMAMAFGISLMHDSDNSNLRIIDADKVKGKDNYLLPTFTQNSDGSMSVVNHRSNAAKKDKFDPLGLNIRNNGQLGNL
tara:strand:+ start:2911 stop:4788 length:1878 start_codon:yes stop_codon:yes gene_type:complete